MKRDLSLYIHIPFCERKCAYCDFLSSDTETYGTQLRYIEAVCHEIQLYAPVADRYIVRTIFIGGGTPSLLDETFITNILSMVRRIFEVDRFAEITIEANPDSIKYHRLLSYRSIGINRLSIGLQSADDALLRTIGRVHNFDQFVAAYKSARRAGFKNINIDIMSGLPGQDVHSYVDTLTRVMEFQPEHISAYSLSVEDGTPLAENEGLRNLIPDEETDRKMYALTKKVLATNGYARYEFSNYAKQGYECRHNIVYWTGGEYIGFGIGAASYFKGERFSNIRNITDYIELMDQVQSEIAGRQDKLLLYEEVASRLRAETTPMYIDSRMEEFMFLGLRMVRGVSRKEFERHFNKDMYEVYGGVIHKYVDEGFMESEGDWVRLNDRGIDVSNIILSDFLLDR
jgi:oxygen-independent coproporphyrinogen-3 oxidase